MLPSILSCSPERRRRVSKGRRKPPLRVRLCVLSMIHDPLTAASQQRGGTIRAVPIKGLLNEATIGAGRWRARAADRRPGRLGWRRPADAEWAYSRGGAGRAAAADRWRG